VPEKVKIFIVNASLHRDIEMLVCAKDENSAIEVAYAHAREDFDNSLDNPEIVVNDLALLPDESAISWPYAKELPWGDTTQIIIKVGCSDATCADIVKYNDLIAKDLPPKDHPEQTYFFGTPEELSDK